MRHRDARRVRPWTMGIAAAGILLFLLPSLVAPTASADACWVDREKAREQRAQKEKQEEEQRRRAEEEERNRPPPPPPEAPSAGAPTPSAPALSGAGSGLATSGGRRAGRPSGAASRRGTWRGWWLVNDRALLPPRAGGDVDTTPTSESEGTASSRSDRCEKVIRASVLPTLHAVLDPEAGSTDLMLRGALIALGKCARTDAAPALLVHWLDANGVSAEIREAAALGIGLLRRTDPACQLDAMVLDALRRRLVRVVEDPKAPDPLRCTAALSVGMLGDQPFGEGREGAVRLIDEHLVRCLADRSTRQDLTVAVLTALGMQPAACVPTSTCEVLEKIAHGRPALGRPFDDVERSHALVALGRVRGEAAWHTLRAVMAGRAVADEVRRAALIALGRMAPTLDAGGRRDAASAVRDTLRRAHDPLTRGLAHVAIGHLVAAERRGAGALRGDLQALWRHLLAQARTGPSVVRGFAAVGLGLALRDTGDGSALSAAWRRARADAKEVLGDLLENRRDDGDAQSAAAVALGLMRAPDAIPLLIAVVAQRENPDLLRWDASVALAQVGRPTSEVVRALHGALLDERIRVRTGAALGLSLLKGPVAGIRLLREMETANTTDEIARLTEPLGYLVGAAEAEAVVRYVEDTSHGSYARASMLVALGNIADAEPRPGLSVLGEHANYAAGTKSLMAAILAR